MVSACPACKREIEHEDFLFEVRCLGCNTRFNPFMTVHEEHPEPAAAPPPVEAPPPVQPAPSLDAAFAQAESVDPLAFGESLGAPAAGSADDQSLDAFTLGEPAAAPSNSEILGSLTANDSPGANDFGGGEMAGGFGDSLLGAEPTAEPLPSNPSSGGLGQFGESNAMMQELRNFGDGLEEPVGSGGRIASPPPPTRAPGAPAPRPSAAASGMSSPVQVSIDPNSERLMTSGDSLPGFQVDMFLSPVSVWTDLQSRTDDPMKGAFDALWKQCQTRGGNAVIGMRWALTADGKVLVTGTPVRGRKE